MLSIFLFFASFFSLLKTSKLLIKKEWGELSSILGSRPIVRISPHSFNTGYSDQIEL